MTQAFPLKWPNGWPRTPEERRKNNGPFNTTIDKARRHLEGQARMLGGQGLVISSNIPLRLDGFPRSDVARRAIGDPGVAVYFGLRDHQMVMARDLYWNVHDNLRSIGLAIEHMRGLERHGGAHMMERAFGGFTALPPPNAPAAPEVNWRTFFEPVPEGLSNKEILAVIETRYRDRAREAHADQGGSDEQMIILNANIMQAREELRA